MFKKSDNYKQEYCAQIVKIGELIPIENSDFLARTVVNGFNVVVGKDEVKEGEIMVYAKLETEVNADFLSVNNQFELNERHLNKNYKEVQSLIDDGKTDEAKKLVGYFNKFGRVRIVKLRKCPSEGCLFKIDSLVNWKPEISNYDFSQCFVPNKDGIVKPFCFDTIGNDLFAKAWVPRIPNKEQNSTNRNSRRNRRLKRFNRLIEGQFSFHYDTNQLADNMWRFNPDTMVTISTKWHGCVERNTIVDTIEFGKKTIGDIVDNEIECHIKAYDIESNEIVYVPIDNFYCVPNDGEWYEIELEDGRKITITGNNPVYLPNLNCYRRVDELIGDEILLIDD